MTERKNVIEKTADYIISFFIYSLAIWLFNAVSGWVVYPEGGFDGGILYGPYSPFPAILVLGVRYVFNLMKKYGKPRNINPTLILLVIISLVIFMGAEYLGSVIYELLTGQLPWDYSEKIFNINGRICWENTVFLTVMEIICVYVAQPFLNERLGEIPLVARIITSMTVVAVIMTDAVCTFLK